MGSRLGEVDDVEKYVQPLILPLDIPIKFDCSGKKMSVLTFKNA